MILKKRYILLLAMSLSMTAQHAPADKQTKSILIMNATAHLGNGQVIQNSAIGFKDGKLTLVADATKIRLAQGTYDTTIDATGKHVYPVLLLQIQLRTGRNRCCKIIR
jgi:hypothetical protein